ncbi:ABC transporter substrate-binding protein [Halomarina halobia]|uniref:ABC transporter substrate-binding protein n=1 Tax=Halomarina halobia TaxID=3033386 RepID=A0ABD6ADM1_9EURY|nr:sugar ABC transporter substrate-binding protein [Halomarina sp. PSR21]
MPFTTNNNRVDRRRFISATGAAGVTLLTGCTGGSDGGSNGGGNGDGGVSLTINMFTGQATDKNIKAFEEAVAAFEEQTGYSVKIKGIAQAGQVINQTQTAVQAGSPPNLAFMPAGGLLGMITNDFLEPVGDRIDSAKTFSRSDFTRERKFDIASLGGEEIYGVPAMSGHWGSLYYNPDMLEQAGYDPKKPNFKTWPEFLDVARDVKDATGVKPIGLSGADHIQTTVQWSGFFHTTGRDSWLTDDKSDTVLDSQPGIDAAKFAQTAVEDGLVPDGIVNMNGIDLRELFKSEKLFAYQTGSWEKAILDEQSDVNYGITWNPQHPDGRPSGFSGGWFFTIPKGAEHQDEAWSLIEHLMKVENISKWAQLPPILTDGLKNTFDGFQDGLGRDVGDIFVKEILNAAFPTIHANQGKMWAAQRQEYQQLLLGQKNADQAMGDLADKVRDLL